MRDSRVTKLAAASGTAHDPYGLMRQITGAGLVVIDPDLVTEAAAVIRATYKVCPCCGLRDLSTEDVQEILGRLVELAAHRPSPHAVTE